jgi:hypothetical protein
MLPTALFNWLQRQVYSGSAHLTKAFLCKKASLQQWKAFLLGLEFGLIQSLKWDWCKAWVYMHVSPSFQAHVDSGWNAYNSMECGGIRAVVFVKGLLLFTHSAWFSWGLVRIHTLISNLLQQEIWNCSRSSLWRPWVSFCFLTSIVNRKTHLLVYRLSGPRTPANTPSRPRQPSWWVYKSRSPSAVSGSQQTL